MEGNSTLAHGHGVVARMRQAIMAVLVLGLIGTIVELVLLEHYEQPTQLIPDVLIAASVLVLLWHGVRNDVASLWAILVVMTLFVLSSFAGFLAHFLGSAEFQMDLHPDMSFFELVEKVLHSKAPPLLAPGMMLQLGLLGLIYAASDERLRRQETR
ncbi:MAG: hypothetical protein U1E56_02830 [Bauldia sp.]